MDSDIRIALFMTSYRTLFFVLLLVLMLGIAIVLRMRQDAPSTPQGNDGGAAVVAPPATSEKDKTNTEAGSSVFPGPSDPFVQEQQREQAEREEEYRAILERYQNNPPPPNMEPGSPPEGVWPE